MKMQPAGDLALSDAATWREWSSYIEMDTGTRPLDDYVTRLLQYERYLKFFEWRYEETGPPAISVFV